MTDVTPHTITLRTVPRPPRPDILRPHVLCCAFTQPLLALRGGLSGWEGAELTTLDADPNAEPDRFSWDRTKFRLKLLRHGFEGKIISYIFTTFETTDFWFPDVGQTFHVAARFERDKGNVEAFLLMELQHQLAVAREG